MCQPIRANLSPAPKSSLPPLTRKRTARSKRQPFRSAATASHRRCEAYWCRSTARGAQLADGALRRFVLMPDRRFRGESGHGADIAECPSLRNQDPGATRMDSALLQNLIAGAGSSSQFIGGLIVAMLYAVIGLLGAIGSILVVRRIFQGRWEQIFWACFLVLIAAFYLSFAAYFGASAHAWKTEVIGVAVFPIGYRGWLCRAWGLGFIPLSIRLFTCGPVDNRHSTGLRYLLLNVRLRGRGLSHG